MPDFDLPIPDRSAELVAALAKRGMTVSTAESCTGGMIAALIVGVPGASNVFPGGAVTYAESVKTSLLGVPEALIAEYGVVSEPVAREMAIGACARFGTDASISVTGLAGPGGGSESTPVGRVYLGASVRGVTEVLALTLPGDRQSVRENAARAAIAHLLDLLGRGNE